MVVLHAYQPPYPIQERFVVKRIVENCYRPIASEILKHPELKVVINMNGSLTEMLAEEYPDVLADYATAVENGQIEMLESGAYHPIFPLISDNMIKNQIQLNHQINSKYIGSCYNPKGVWPPELAVDTASMRLLASLGYEYAMAPMTATPENAHGLLKLSCETPFYLVRRNKEISNRISFNSYSANVDSIVSDIHASYQFDNVPMVLSMDIETYGEHVPNYWHLLIGMLTHPHINPMHFHDLKDQSGNIQIVDNIQASSWSTDPWELDQDNPYPLWKNPMNRVHTIQNKHLDLLAKLIASVDYSHLSLEDKITIMKSFHSCQTWWASGNNVIGRWSPEMVKKGMTLQQVALQKIIDTFGTNNGILEESTNLSEQLIEALQVQSA